MILEHGLSRIVSLDSLQRYYRFPAHLQRTQLHASMIRTRIFTRNRKRSANEQKGSFLNLRVATTAQDPLDITVYIQEGASAKDKEFQPRIHADLLEKDHHEEKSIIFDITTINTATEMVNFGKKWPKQWEFTDLFSLTWIRQNLEIHGGGKQNKIGGDTGICCLLRNQLKYSQMKCHTHMLTAPELFHLRRVR
ncbi:MAG: hypothetical protein EZS28_000744 [Streblomastix strix]|uniref:Uncharacterized protein n=1 Tax=Streblomastix strix TaxID=222440 RepID=A0A5J4XB44_9EUKA|nr:MAG: hypothetical protein EZS28_000744 [Streblomastix strix]